MHLGHYRAQTYIIANADVGNILNTYVSTSIPPSQRPYLSVVYHSSVRYILAVLRFDEPGVGLARFRVSVGRPCTVRYGPPQNICLRGISEIRWMGHGGGSTGPATLRPGTPAHRRPSTVTVCRSIRVGDRASSDGRLPSVDLTLGSPSASCLDGRNRSPWVEFPPMANLGGGAAERPGEPAHSSTRRERYTGFEVPITATRDGQTRRSTRPVAVEPDP